MVSTRVAWCLGLGFVLAFGDRAAGEPELDARFWFNNPPVRLHDDRRIILFFFECDQRESADWARRLRTVARRPDTLVIGLTRDGKQAVERFIDRNKVAFAIGAGSKCAKAFEVVKFPAILVVSKSNPSKFEATDPESVLRSLPTWKQSLNEIDGEASLRDYIESDADGHSRAAALDKLWDELKTSRANEMGLLAEQRLPEEPDPWVRGLLRYYRDVARGMTRADRQQTLSSHYFREYREKPDDPRWSSAKAIQSQLESAAPSELLALYHSHGSQEPADVLIRRMAAFRLATEATRRSGEPAYRSEARAALLEMLHNENDASIRMITVMGIGKAAAVGDSEVIAYLEALAPIESDDFRVRPMMEYVAHYLRTGESKGPAPSLGP